MDLDNMTLDELEDLQTQLYIKITEARDAIEQNKLTRSERIANSIQTLESLLGPEGAPAGVDSIRAISNYDGETMAENAYLALPLIIAGMEILTKSALDIAKYVSE